MIKVTSEAIEKYAHHIFKKLDITFSQGRILVLLQNSNRESISLKELETLFHSSQQTVAGIVSRMEEKSLLTSFHDTKDKRIKQVTLTKKGQEVALLAIDALVKLNEELTAPIPEEKKDDFLDMLWSIYKNAEKKSGN